ncbi:flavodoxin [Mitsuokella multacida]|uniref:flavodoxin n=1 Tax=Mitsuokella multacida TaxID=52226 RepID=UPI00242F3817|nr:flavodoxin [Mitsuokella multacida]
MNRREFLKMGGMSVMALVLGGCGLSSLTGSSSNGQAANSAASGVAASSSGTVAAGGKTLVVYYSATGRTERVAKVIAKERQADIMKLVPNLDYTEADLDYNDKSSRVSREHDDASLRDKIQLQKAVPDNWASYDTIFLGYPIWWSIAAWPVDAFVKANDFTGKNVVTFATAGVSPLGNSGKLLAEMAGGKGNWQDGGKGNWQDGTCFTGSLDDAKVQEWVRSLNLAK